MRGRVHLLAFVLGVVAFGCSDSDEKHVKSNASTVAPPTSETVGPLDAACQDVEEILRDISLNDTQIAAALRAIETHSQGLAEAIEETARGFADGEASIPDIITPLCTGDTAGVPELTEDQQRFLTDARALNPSLDRVGDNDLLQSIDLACYGLGVDGHPSNRDQMLGLAYAPLPELEDGEAVLRAGIPIFCPQHQQIVNDLL